MPDQRIVDLIAASLAHGLPHPGDPEREIQPHTVMLPGFNTIGMTDEQAKELVGTAAREIGEAIAHLIETAGYTVILRSELDELRADAAEATSHTRTVRVHCHCDTNLQQPLLEITVGNRDIVKVPGRIVLQELQRRNPDCPHEEIA